MSREIVTKISFLCFGAGAIGTYIGGSLASVGHKVVFVDRPSVAVELRQRGLQLGLKQGKITVSNPAIVSSLGEAFSQGPFDAAILAVKSYDTAGLLDQLKAHILDVPPIICLQNGIDNEPLIASVLGWKNVISATVTTAVGKRGLGSIEVERLRGVGIDTLHPLSRSLIAAFSGAGLKATGYQNRLSIKWSKMLTNLLANASSAILNISPAEIFNDAGLFHLEKLMVQEALTVMSRMKIPVIDLPGTPVKLLVWLLMNLPEFAGRAILSQVLGKGRGGKMPSFHIDLYAGNPQSEVGYLNGAVVREGEQSRIPTPVNRFLTSVLTEMVGGKLPRDHYGQKPAMLLTDLANIRKE